MANLIDIKGLPGFKLPDSHFKLGSKIHIRDFYFAKRFFQNGFFASRFAFLIADYISKNYRDESNNFIGDLTLIGYGLYSELLLSLTVKFLKLNLKTKSERVIKINHDLINDTDDLELIKHEKFNKHIIIIVPIASTFSTSMKIEEVLLDKLADDKNQKIEILRPHLNLLHVCDGIENDKVTPLETTYGWDTKDSKSKIITIKALFQDIKQEPDKIEQPDRESRANSESNKLYIGQKYFLSLPSKWYDINKCGICFPKDVLEEKPLFETDKTSVTPALIFDYPKGRNIPGNEKSIPKEKNIIGKEKNKFILSENELKYGHIIRNENHFHYYIGIEEFFEENIVKIEKWLKNLRTEQRPCLYSDTEYIVIIAPCQHSNVSFVNKVNDIMFSSSANIIHYDPFNDYIQNFYAFYGTEIKKAQKIFFVDDTLTSGNTFIRCNYFLKHIRSELKSEFSGTKGFDACFFLLNRSSHYVFENVKRKLVKSDNHKENIFSFANLHLPSLKDSDAISPLVKEKLRYKQLTDDSFLDRLKEHFIKQENKLEESSVYDKKIRSEKKHLKMVDAIHRIFEYFIKNSSEIKEFNTINQFIDEVEKIKCPFEKIKWDDEDSNITLVESAYLKVLTQHVFSQYQPLKVIVFKWILEKLNKTIIDIKKVIKNDSFDHKNFRDLKFLMRRAGLLNSNILISEYFIVFLMDLCGEKGIKKLITENLNRLDEPQSSEGQVSLSYHSNPGKVLSELLNFNFFYAAQIKELIFTNETRSIKLEGLLKEYADKGTPFFKHIIRILREENVILIKNFIEFLKKTDVWKEEKSNTKSVRENEKNENENENKDEEKDESRDVNNDEDSIIDYSNKKIEYILKHQSIINHYKYKSLYNFFDAKYTDGFKNNVKDYNPEFILKNKDFINYLWLMKFFSSERKGKMNLNQKTDLIVSKLKDIINEQREEITENENAEKNTGVFFVVKLGEKDYVVAYNKNEKGVQGLDETELKNYFYFEKNEKATDSKNLGKKNYPEYLINFLKGEQKDNEIPNSTVLEFQRTGEQNKENDEQSEEANEQWKDMYSTDDNKVDEIFRANLLPKYYNRLILLRIGRYENGEDKPQGIIGFYFKKSSDVHTDINKIRYLLLLRTEIGRFIETHHENDEFKEWQIADVKQRTSLLTGHGREMLIDVSLHYPEYCDKKHAENKTNKVYKNADKEKYNKIVLSLLLIQRLIIDRKEAANFGFSESKVMEVFESYFGFQVDKIDKNYFKKLKIMAEEIFDFDDIENKENVDVKLNVSPLLKNFPYSKALLDMICFEIFINAKKNRLIFLNAIKGEYFQYETNHIDIEVRLRGENLEIIISNTGPEIQTIDDLNIRDTVKKYESSAGIELIKLILREFNKGKIIFYPKSNFVFSASLTLWPQKKN